MLESRPRTRVAPVEVYDPMTGLGTPVLDPSHGRPEKAEPRAEVFGLAQQVEQGNEED
jgi:hypothetical protein